MSIIIVPCKCESYRELLLAEAIFNKLYGKIHLKVYKKLYTIDETQLIDGMNKAKYEIIKKIRDIITTLKTNKIKLDDVNYLLVFGDIVMKHAKLVDQEEHEYLLKSEQDADQVCETVPKHKEL